MQVQHRAKAQVTSTHSYRCTPELYEATQRRADLEGVAVNAVITEIMEGYARGLIDLPRITKAYTSPRKPRQMRSASAA